MSGYRSTRVCFLLLATLTSVPWASSQAGSQGHPLTFAAGRDPVVRFFCQPPDGEYFHVALLLRAAKKDDPRWNTTAYSDLGRTAYVSLSDMKRFMTMLTHLSLRWDESPKVESLEGVGIKVLSANHRAKALIAVDKICETLASLDGALLTPRALGEFQGFRRQYHCQVPNFNLEAYPFP